MFSILRQNCKLVKPTGRAHLKKGGRLPKLPLKPGSIPPPQLHPELSRLEVSNKEGAVAQSAPHKAPGWRRARGATARTRRERRAPAPVPVPERGRLTDVPLDGDLLDACPLGAGGGRRAEPLGRGGHAWLATARARDAGARLCWELGAEASRSRRRDQHFDFSARRRRRLGGPAERPRPGGPDSHPPRLSLSSPRRRDCGTTRPARRPRAPRAGAGLALRARRRAGAGLAR